MLKPIGLFETKPELPPAMMPLANESREYA
jgi:hypothetical protein